MGPSWLAATAALCLFAPARAVAQDHPAWMLIVDNDHFNFWQPEHRRPDVEYTQGLDLSVSLPATGRGGPLRWLWPADQSCPAAARCTRWRVGLRQEIYTPSLDQPPDQPGQRPYAGWLAVHVGLERGVPAGGDRLRLLVGVTGEPSLAAPVQRAAHALFGDPEPEGWAAQLPFEPGVQVEYQATRRLLNLTDRDATGVSLAGVTGVQAGTAAVGSTAGVQLSMGLGAGRPWQGGVWRPSRRLALYLIGGARLDVVLRSTVLQGTLFRESRGVAIRHLVAQYELGAALRYGRVALEWRAVHRDREYRTQPEPHTYSRVGLALLP